MRQVFLARKVITVSIIVLLLMLVLPKPAHALYWYNSDCVAGPRDSVTGLQDTATIKGFECLFSNAISVVLALAGIVLFVMFLIGGLRYLTSGGDPKATESAKGTLTHAIAGLVVLILAFLILKLIETITGVQLTIFKVTQ